MTVGEFKIGEEIALGEAQAGDIITFTYFGGSNHGGQRDEVKVIKSSDDNAGNLLGLIRPYDEKNDFRQYRETEAYDVVIVGNFNPEAAQVNFIDAQETVTDHLGDSVLANRLVQRMNTCELARAMLEASEGDEVESVTFNDVTAQFEVHPVKRSRFLSDNGRTQIFVQSASGREFCFGSDANGEGHVTDADSALYYKDPIEFANALLAMLND